MKPSRLPAPFDQLAYAAYRAIFVRLRSSRWLHRQVFGYEPLKTFPGPYWDYSTLDLRGELARLLRPDMRFLDMGTGPFAVLGLFAALKCGAQHVTACDRHPEAVASARRQVAALGLNFPVLQSDLFAALDGPFDLIAFNPPYLPTDYARDLGIFRRADERERWDGGPDGLAVIRPFLAQATRFLATDGTLLLGVSHLFLDRLNLLDAIATSGYRIERQQGSPLGWSHLYVLKTD